MGKKYQLWIDESGDFRNEASKKNDEKKSPSLVGGILVEEAQVVNIVSAQMIGNTGGHACRMNSDMKLNHVLPTLEQLQQNHLVKQVFFENADYEDEDTNRQLYLRIIAEGLLQLLLTLNAINESVELKVLIAQRQDVEASEGNHKILEIEYVHALKNCIEKKKAERRIILDSETSLEIDIAVANQEERLQLADYACNTRLTRGSHTFRNETSRLEKLYSDAYIFTMHELGTLNYMKQELIRENVSGAILELYTTQDKVDREQAIQLIIEKMKSEGYRLMKSQMRHCASEIISYAYQVDDYEIGEAFLKDIEGHFVPAMKAEQFPVEKLHFTLLIQLSDMYLREGDIVNARESLERCRRVHGELDHSLEEVFSYYQLIEKEAVLYINEFNYEKASKLMGDACYSYLNVMGVIEQDESLNNRFPKLKSEYLGDALCMQIYAMMFMQRRNPDLYMEMCELSELALEQYSNYEGELERHRQYRAHIECEAKHYEEALNWLFLSKCYHVDEVNETIIEKFLDEVCDTELECSCCYYLMYFLHIMSEAKLAGNPLGDCMYHALDKQVRLAEIVGIRTVGGNNTEDLVIDISEIKEQETGIEYHPVEIVYWKYATYLYCDKQYKRAQKYYDYAVQLCFRYSNYHTMRITGYGILAESICCLVQQGENALANRKLMKLRKKMIEIQYEEINQETKAFVKELQDIVSGETCSCDELWKLSRMITY